MPSPIAERLIASDPKAINKHFHATEHPIIRSFQPGEDWQWCYIDEVFL
jgi:hypothetical protein